MTAAARSARTAPRRRGRAPASSGRSRSGAVRWWPARRRSWVLPCAAHRRSHFEVLRIAALDLVGRFRDRFGILTPQLDVGELAHARLLDRLLVRRVLPGIVDQELLA